MAAYKLVEYRNAKYNYAGGIDCEIYLKKIGWVPTTASIDDPETKDLYHEVKNKGDISIADENIDLVLLRVRKVIIGYASSLLNPIIGSYDNAGLLDKLSPMLNMGNASDEIKKSLAIYNYSVSLIEDAEGMSYKQLTLFNVHDYDWPYGR